MPDERIIGGYYRVEGLIGQGGMGTVYHGVDIRTDTPVAIKQLRPELVESNVDVVQRFTREAEALRKLNHPNIIKVLATINEDGHHYIVMEYISGGSLEDLLSDTRQLPVDRVLNIALDLSDALTRAHRLKIIHRDIKPANVLLRDDGSPILTDFGVARMSNATRVTETGIIMGTVPYLSPESLYGAEVDEGVDMWALGIMLYEMLTGSRPFRGETVGAIINNIITQPAPDFYTFRSDIPWTLMGLIYWMLEKSVDDRPTSIRLIGAVLENIMSGEVVPVRLESKLRAEPTYRPGREELIRAVIEYATLTLRADGGKIQPPTPTPTEVAAILSGDAPAQGTPTVVFDTPSSPRFIPRIYWMTRAVSVIAIILGMVVIVLAISNPPAPPKPTNTPTSNLTGTPPPPPTDGHIVLVAQFEHIDGTERDVQRFIVENLQRNFERSPYSDMRIRMYNQVIRDEDTARQIGVANGAEVVIWGQYDTGGVTAEIQLGSIEKFPAMVIDREDAEKLLNVRVNMVNERRETLAYNIVAVINLLSSISGDAFSVGRNLLILNDLDDTPGTIAGNDMATRYHRYIRFYFENPTLSVEEITKAVSLAANDPMVYAIRGLGYQHLGDVQNARIDIATAERLGGREWLPALMLRITDTLFIEPDYSAGIGYLNRFIAQQPDNWWAISMRGTAHYILGHYDEADADMQKAIMLGAEASYPYTFVMAIHLRRGEFVEAQRLLKWVLENFPDPTFSENLLLTTLSPKSADNLFVALNAGVGHVILAHWQNVLNATQASVDAGRANVDVYFLRGFAQCNLDQHAEAEASYTHAIELDDSFSLLYLMRADVRQKQQNLVGAASDLTIALARPELQWIAPAFTLDKLGDIDCKSFLETDFASLRAAAGTPESTAEAGS